MRTPVDDFVRDYAARRVTRLHMPGHKGVGAIEALDITEIDGADSLFEASGILHESEENAGRLFGAHTLYSTEGSSLCIRAMLALAVKDAAREGRPLTVLCARNAHKTLVSAAALLDLCVDWLYPRSDESYLCCTVTAEDVEAYLASHAAPAAVYITSPDYLGNRQSIRAIAEVCHAHGTLLLVDNAHGAYLAFLTPSEHPIAQGADMCCDSAHKTLPVLTGGAYLHIAHGAPSHLHEEAKDAMALFASTSPSYLILASLDRANRVLAEGYGERLSSCLASVREVRERLLSCGYETVGDEPMKLTLCPRSYGYTGTEVADYLCAHGFVCEMADADHVVLMPTPSLAAEELIRLGDVLCALARRAPLPQASVPFSPPERVMSVREATLSPSERCEVCEAQGRVLAAVTVGCPPAVPIVVSGERLDAHAIARLTHYGVRTVRVVRE